MPENSTDDLTDQTAYQNSDPIADDTARVISEHPIAYVFRYIYEIIKTVIVILVIALVIRTFLIQPFVVDGNSMEPTFHNAEYLMVEKVHYTLSTPQRGDIIVFKYPLNPSLNYVKRVIGLPGDRVVIANGKVVIFNNDHTEGLTLDETYLSASQLTRVNGDGRERSWVVAPDSFFVMGDNRDHSDDSRSWGLVPKANVVGKVWVTVYPVNEFGLVQHATY